MTVVANFGNIAGVVLASGGGDSLPWSDWLLGNPPALNTRDTNKGLRHSRAVSSAHGGKVPRTFVIQGSPICANARCYGTFLRSKKPRR